MVGDNEGYALQVDVWAWTQVQVHGHGHGHGLIEGGSHRMGRLVHAEVLPAGALRGAAIMKAFAELQQMSRTFWGSFGSVLLDSLSE